MPTYADIRDQIQSFDILVFSGEGLISKVIQLGSMSKWSHVGVALRLDDYDQVLIYESTRLSNVPDLVTGRPVKGVQLVPLSSRVKAYEGELGWLPIKGQRQDFQKPLVAEFLRDYEGRPYEQNHIQLMRAALDTITLKQNKLDASSVFCSVFCSEMACLLLETVNIQRPGPKPANEYTPADYANGKFPLYNGWGIGDLVEYGK